MKHFLIYITLIFTFFLGIRDGFIALWTDPGAEPYRVYPYRATSLPPADREALEKGIRVETPEELNLLLEDYLS